MKRLTHTRIPVLALLLAALGPAASARAASPDLRDLLPRGGQRGTEVTVTMTGNFLGDAQEILHYEPGLSTKSLKAVDDKKVEAVFALAPDARLGEHQFRLRTASGVSYVRTFWIGPFPGVAETEPNNSFDEAQSIDLNITAEGFANTEDVDYFKIQAKKGQRVSVEIEGVRLGGNNVMFDPYIALLRADGAEVAVSDDTALLRQDAALSVIVPEDGAYLVEIRDSAYGGSSAFRYRAHIGTFPRPTAVYPAGGKAGSELEVTFLGDPKGPVKQKIALPAKPNVTETFDAVLAQDGQQAPSANRVRVTALENVLEVEPNDEPAQAVATELALPVAFNGILEKEGDTDHFRFKARKDQKFRVRALGQGVYTPVDTTLAILDAQGKQIAYSDDADGSTDSRLDFTAPADGEYLIRVYDMLKRGGADCVYRVEATAFEPMLSLTMSEQERRNNQLLKAMVAHQGNRFAAVVNVTRQNLRGDVAFDVPNLPAGMTFKADTVPANASNFPIVFYAAPDAPVAGKLTQLKGRIVNDEKVKIEGVYTQQVDLVRGNPNGTLYYAADNDQIPVAVAGKAPYTVDIEVPKTPILQEGPLALKIKTTRVEGFDADITVRMLWKSPGLSCNPYVRLKKDEPETEYLLTASGTAETGDWKIIVRGEASTPTGTVYVASDLTPITVAPAYFTGKIDLATVEQGAGTKLVCKLEQVRDFEGNGKLELFGLPDKATAEPVEITKSTEEIAFAVKTDPATPTGQHKNLYCQLTVTGKDGLATIHQLAKGGILRVDPPAPKAAGTDKKEEPKKDPKVATK